MADQFFKTGFVDVRFADGGRFCDRKPTGHVFWQSFYLTNLARRDKTAQLLSVLTDFTGIIAAYAWNLFQYIGVWIIYVHNGSFWEFLDVSAHQTVVYGLANRFFRISFNRLYCYIWFKPLEIFLTESVQTRKIIGRFPSSSFSPVFHEISDLPFFDSQL